MSWAYQGVECSVAKAPLPGHRLLRLAPRPPDGKRGSRCYVARERLSGHVPLYVLRHKIRDSLCYCATIDELVARQREGYVVRELAGYVMLTEDALHAPLMRTYDPRSKRYFYTTHIRQVDSFAPEIRAAEVKGLLQKIFKQPIEGPNMDDRFFCPTEQAARQIIANSRVALREYSSEVMDCDDFAHMLKSAFIEDACDIYDLESSIVPRPSKPYAVGVVLGLDRKDRPHAMNVLVTSDGRDANDYRIWLVEPQQGRLIEPRAFRRHLKSIEWLIF